MSPILRFALYGALVVGPVVGACAESDSIGEGFQQGDATSGGGGDGGKKDPPTSASTGIGPATTGSGSTSSGSGGAESSSSSGTPCSGKDAEPNDTESTAHDLGSIDDCDGSGAEIQGTIAMPGDIDWYKYQGDDSFGCVVDPTRTFAPESPLRICKFIQCVNGNPEFGCPSGTTPTRSPDGRQGCCGQDGFDLDINCDGADDDAAIYVRIDSPDQDPCVDYTLGYHF